MKIKLLKSRGAIMIDDREYGPRAAIQRLTERAAIELNKKPYQLIISAIKIWF